MGNHLVGMAPAQIFPVEHYLNDGAIKDLQFVKSLGSTRFFKVALTRHVPTQTLIVVKIFTLQDISLQLRTDRDKILAIKKALEDTPNCLTFQRACSTERAGFVIRQYMKHSVYDRMSTRPFLTVMEKKWIAFQLLLAIQQAHKHKICHGDIKLENVMVTSWNWVYLTDFASFKPTFLPEDNPADFSYFFDTSRRRTCYIAPERFKSSHPTGFDAMLAANSQYLPNTNSQSIIENGELLPSMDIFSVGCCLIELFTESSPFTFSHLLAYRAGEFAPTKVLDKIEDPDIRTLVEQMIQKDPSQRLSANECLSQQKGQAFPQFFYSFLQSYMQIFCTESSMMPDNKINKLHENVDSILKMLETEPDFDGHGLTLLVTLVTANIRSLRFSDSKLQALSILTKMSQHIADDILLDRVLPYVIHLLNDRFPAVRIGALQTLTDCLKFVSQVPLADANIFPEYILPSVVPLCHDKCELVRSSLARVIADLAQESVRFLNLTLKSGDFCPSDRTLSTYDNEVASLQNSFHEIVSVLLSDSVNSVKQSLLEHSVEKLAVFFGRVKANDVLLSHMITFLNDKDDAYLRDSFYQSIGGVVAFVGWQCSQILLPLLQQGLCDSEEFVIVRCINAMAELTSLGMLEKISLHSLLKETVPYLIHPNLWIRQATCDFISSAAKQMSEVDVLVKLGRILEPFVREEVIQVQTPAIVFSKLHEHLPRDLFEMVLKSGDIDGLLSILETRRTKRAMSNFHLGGTSGMNPVLHAEVPTPMQQLLKRLQNEGMSPEVEDQLLMYREHLIKMAQNRANFKLKKFDGMVDLTRYMAKYNLELRVELLNIDPRANLIRPIPEHQHVPPVNEEWQQLFGPEASPGPDYASEAQSGLDGPGSNLSIGRSVSPAQSGATTSPRRSRTPQPPSIEKSYEPSVKWETSRNVVPDQDPGFYPQCKITLDHLLRTKRGEYALHAKKRAQLGYGNACDKSLPSYDWRLQGTLLTHLHEHEMGIVQLARIPDRPIFVSASLDGTVRLWDISSFETNSVVDRSHKQYREFEGCPLTSLDVSGAGDLMATSAENGSICVQSVETGDVIFEKTLDTDNEGPAIKLHFQETGTSPILAYATAFGGINGVDLRMPGPAFHMENEIQNGLQTAFAISPDQCWCVSGTLSGNLICWDMRFQLPVVKLAHPSETRIRDLQIQPRSSSVVLVAVQGNNEVGFWSMENQFRQRTLWASPSPVLSSKELSGHSVTSLHPIFTDHSNQVITAGTDMRVRVWNLRRPQDSYIAIPAGRETINPNHVAYSSSMVDGTEVIKEVSMRPKSSGSSNSNNSPGEGPNMTLGCGPDSSSRRPGLERAAIGHHNWISSTTMCDSKRWYVVTGSRDGVIKVWF